MEQKTFLKMNLRFFENLCETNMTIVNECSNLKKNKIIHDYLIRNGFVKIVKKEGEQPIKINHPDELYDIFFDYFGY